MKNNVKFVMNLEDCNCNVIEEAFKKAKGIFNWQLDEDYNAILIKEDIDYRFIDVLDFKKDIGDLTDSFFKLDFDDSINVPLYKFMVLKDNDKFKILANISSLIFDYTSINDFYELFDDLNKSSLRNDLDTHYTKVNDYLNSPDFKKNKNYWKNFILNSNNHVKFYNLKDNNCKSQTINVNEDSVNSFINANSCSLFEFYGSAFSMYLSRIDRLDGSLLKTIIPHENMVLDKNTLLKVDVNRENSFNDLIDVFRQTLVNALEKTKVDIACYFDENSSYYSIYDFTDLNRNIHVLNGDNSALTLNIYNDSLEIVYNSNLFSDIYINHMVGNIESLIDELLHFPNQLIRDIDILSSEEKALLLKYCKGKRAEVDENRFLSHGFRENALNNPDALAVDDGVNKITFGELEKSSNSIANDLRENYNMGQGSRVALMLMRDYHFPEIVLALNKISATFVPIDLFYPIKRIEYMLNLSQSEYVIATKAIADSFDLKQKVIYLEDLNDSDDVDVEIATRGDDLFTIIFTSGTTGLPKGVMISNSQIPGVGISFREIFDYCEGDVIGHYLGFTFVASFVIYAALYFGGCCRIFNETEQKDSLLLIKELKENHLNSLILPPGIGIPIYENEDLQLDYLVLAGTKLNELSKKKRNTQLINFYGTTEIICGITKIYDLKDIKDNNVPLGTPVANSRVYILDDDNNQMPIGVPGEICVSNNFMSPGYLDNPELTDELFIENPFSDSEDNRIMYRTGDIGFYNFDGEIEIIGREDDQLSVRGFRIESDEILRIMEGFDGISDIYLDVDNDNLIAYYTTDENLDIDDVKDALKDELPYYMIPSLFIELDEIPLNLNGKIDKSRLKIAINNKSIEIADEVIRAVADAFREVLNLDFVMIDDDFVSLGGNSLSAMKLQLALKEKLDVYLSSNDLIGLSTPNEIANHIKFNLNLHSSVDDDNYTFDKPCALSESQLNVYLDENVKDMGTAYNNPFKIDFKDDYSTDEIRNSLIKLFEVYPVLKARIVNDDGDLFFAFDGEPEINEGSVNDIKSFVKPFEFDKSLSRFLIVENSLCVDFHHMIFDGTSLNILLNRLISILSGQEADFTDYGLLRQISFEENIDSDYMDGAHEFFSLMLADVDEVHDLLPSVNDDNDEFEFIDSFDIDFDDLNSFLQSHNLTHNQFFSSVFAYTLSRFTGSDKILFNIIEDGRGHIDLSDSVGMFVKTLPVLIDCSNNDVNSFLDYSSDLINSVMKYDLYPFRALANDYDLNSNILFQYSHNLFSDVINKDDLKYGVDELDHDLNADLSFYIFNNSDDKLTIRILYSSTYSKDFIEHFTESYKLILHEMIKVEELGNINFTSDSDLEFLDSYNQTEHPLFFDDIMDAFNDNLTKHPEKILVSYNDVSYSYGESAFIADAIGKKLADLGVEVQDCVSFLVPRSELYMFSVLGILSAGAVYVPLNDAHPDEHIKFMLHDTDSQVIIVSDETYERTKSLANNINLLNISDIVKKDVGNASNLDISYGDLACILYTSGTTGVPKGVKITRKSVINVADSYIETYGLDKSDVYGLFSSIGFDVSSFVISVVMRAGACLSIIPEEIRFNMSELNKYFIKQNVTHAFITTQVGKLFMQSVDDTSLDVLLVAGEKLGDVESPKDYLLIDAYGPTEAFAFVSSIDNNHKLDDSSVGMLNYNTKAYILDNQKRRVPLGAVGELYLSGLQVAEGYLNHPEKNAKAFLDNPFDDNKDYNTLYGTGDLVRILPDGSIGIVGRRDGQVKIRGNRVELSEVEITIRNIDIIDDVTVKTIKNGDNHELVAYVVSSEDIGDDDLRNLVCDYVTKNEPEYMVPSFVVRLHTIPLNVNGKVDKSALPDVDLSTLHEEYVAPTNEIERHIVDAFELVFNQKGIGLNDNFIHLGGDSITAIRVISLLEKNDISCNARDILNYKTPYLIAQNVQSIESVSYDAVEGSIDLLPIQEFFFDQINRDNFSQHFILKSNEKLDKDTLQKSFNELYNVHDMLRARYDIDEKGDVNQEILPVHNQICEINEYDISDDIEESLKEIFIKSFNSLNIDNLIEINLIHHNDASYLMLIIHHLIIDGVSWNILITDLTHIYNSLKVEKQISLSRPYPYKNWVDDVKDLLRNISPEEKEHWTKINALLDDYSIKGDANPFAFRVDANYDIDSLLMLSEEEYWALAIARAYKKTYGKDIIFNRETYGRDESIAKLNRTIGWFTSQYPILVNVDNDYDDVSLINDVYNLKTAFKEANNLGLNYYSLIYTTKELEFKSCPVTFNFLSSAFSFKNELFESFIPESSPDYEEMKQDLESYGITFNVVRNGNSYEITGDYAGNTYIGDEFNAFIENIKYELEFIGNHKFEDDNVICCLSEAQLGIYLDEKVHEKDVAYSTIGIFEYGHDYSINKIKDAIHAVIRKHPILKGRVLDTANMPLLICDSYPTVEMVDKGDCSDLIKPFDLDKSLARFFIVDSEDSRFVFYDIHHMISDATSHTIIKNNLKQALMGELDDAIDYGFVYASHDSFETQYGEKFKSAQEFFHNTFADIDDVQHLLRDVNGKIGSVSLPVRDIRENVELFAQNNNITVGSLLNAVFAYTYSRFTGSDKVYYNFTEHGRHEDYMQDAVGMFVRTIPVIVGCENKSVNDYVTNVADLILKSMANSIYPFRLTAREFNLSNDVAFEYNYDLNEFEVGDDIVVRDDADKVSDFLCVVNDLEDGFLITVSHLDKFSQHTATQFVKVFKEVLIQILEKENLGDIDYISTEDIELLDSYNKTEHPLVYNDILDAFNDNLSKYPENRLVSCNDVSYTYAEGAYISDAIGKKLLELGIKPQNCVGFLVPRSELYMFCILSCMSVGAVYVPLDDTLPDERIAFMMKDTDSRVIIASDNTYERAKELADDIAILNISDILKEDIKYLSSLPVGYEDIASIIYTSGTTGVPKGVKITRRAILNVATYYGETFGLDSSDVYGLYASIGFDAGMMSIFKAIYSGACLSVVPEEIRYNMYKLNDYFIEQNVTHTIITTPVGKLFMREIDDSSLDYLFVGGEKLGEIESPKNCQLVDEYGPSEANNFISSINNSDKIHSSSVGKLNYNSKAYILDDEKRRVPCGAVGELYLAGYQIAEGYLNREEETNKSFVENPFDEEEDYNTLYRTGDLVRILPDGSLAIEGRRDGQVKIRGNRVELSEVENVIRQLDYVSDVTVQTIKSKSNNELVAYVVLSHEIGDVKDCICDYVTKYKPDYMVPSFVMELDEIPLNVNGKVNRSALPKVDLESLHDEYVAPRNETEKHIAEAFEYVFNQKDIGVNDDFVHLGGDSITAIRVISILEKNDISCTAKDILNYKTPSLIAQNVQIVESISYDAVEGTVDLLPIQEYFFDQVTSDNFSQYYILKSNEKLDIDTLQESFNELCNVHDMLRADYSLGENGDVIQEILSVNTQICEINEYNISNDFKESIKDIFIKSLNSLDVESNLIEINLIHHKSTSYLMFIIHHLIIDGVSWDILITDLTNIYNNLKARKEIGLQRPYPYKNWVEDIKNLVNDISPDEKRYWTKINDLLDDSSIKGYANPFIFDVDVNYDIDNLLMLSEEEYLALAIARAYNKTYGKDVIFKRETYGRDESIAKINRTVGWFTSQYPILVYVNNDYSDVSLMNDVYNIKSAFNEANNLGLNYYSLIYTTKELEFKHCPVTFNFLSSEFSFKNELFESIIPESLLDSEETDIYKHSLETYGITFNVFRDGNSYRINGQYAGNTYIGDKFNKFIENIKSELKFIGNYKFKDNNIVCCLSEPQLGIYLDEKVHKKGLAYSNPRIFNCDSSYTISEIEDAIHALIKKHPILKGRVLDTANMPLLICDSYPSIEIANDKNYSNFIKPFDLDKSLAAFIVVDSEAGKYIIYNVHHIISDATTATLINKELKQALMGKLDDEIDLGFVYASRDSFEVQYDNKYESAQKFFQDNFADIDKVQYLLRDVDGKIGSVSLPIRGIRENVESFTKKNNITVSSLLNAVFAYTYSRFTGCDKVYYNFTEHGRHEDYLQDAWGMFIRTIPVIVDCENRSIADYVDYTSDLILKSMINSIYPFRLLAREFSLNNDVAFEYNHDLNDFDIGNDLVVSDDADGISEFLCVVNDLEDGFVVTVSHLNKFNQHTAKQFIEVFKEVLVQFLEKEKLDEINYISNEDIELLDSYNKTQHQLKYDDILDAFNDNLAKYPKNSLVTYKNNSYAYDEGAFIANEISDKLRSMGVNKDDNVAFLVERSELYMFSILGILSAGAVYVPLDDALPDERIKFMMDDNDVKVVIVCVETYNRAKNLSEEIKLLNISNIIKEPVGTSSKLDVTYGDLACILYTSGTTGIPKGVKITRRAVLNLSQSYCDTYDLSWDDVYALYSNIGFDAGSQAILQTIYAGACLTVVPDDVKFNIHRLNEYFLKQNVTHTFISTQVAKLFMEQIDNTSLKILSVGGEKLGEFESPNDYRLIDAYGPTESFAYVSSIDNNNKLDGSSAGMINYNTHVHILDDEFRRVPVGAVGELYLAGYQIADGYLNRPEENTKSFINNPFDNEEGYEILYRTGDMVRLLPDGSLGIVGRRDSQVKIRGNRVELSEIEAVIREIDYVDDVTVQTVKHDTNNEVVAYVVINNEMSDDMLKDSIASYVGKHKPEYMVPSFVVKLECIPLNVNGKVDKRALPDVDVDSLRGEYVAPRNEIEKEIVEAFKKALNLEKVSIHDDFIHLGGDSLTAIRLLSYITSHDVTMADIFTFRTPEAIAKNMSDYSFDLDIYSLESGCPLNSAQINVFADVNVYNKKNAYHIPGYISIPKEYSLENILESLNKLLDAHPILSMRLSDKYEVNDNIDMSNLDLLKDLMTTAKKYGINEIINLIKAYGVDVRGLYNMLRTIIRLFKGEYPYLVKGAKPPISVETDVSEYNIIDFFSESFDLYNYLSKFLIVENKDSYYLIYWIHHIVFDAMSAGVFQKDFMTLLNGGDVAFDDTFLKTSAFTHQIKNTEKFDEAGEFYEPILSNIDDVGVLREDSLPEGYSSSVYDLEFDKAAFKSFLNKAGISENVFFTSIFAYTLSQFSDGDKVLFTMIENGRDRFSESFIGMTSNVMPIIADCKNQSISSFMEQMADTIYGALRYSYYPILLLYQKYNFEVNILFQFLPNWITDDFNTIDDAESYEIYNKVINSFQDSLTEFLVQVYQNGTDYRIVFTNSNKYSDKMINDFKDVYISVLSKIINDDMSSNLNSIK